jgi:ubiquinone/menaquinone biosynthesis C-methylase UbiE
MTATKSHSDWQASVVEEARAWNSIAEGWHAWIPKMREWYAPATELMLDLARLQAGDRVLDIAAGDCDQSMAAARRVGQEGYLLAVDVAEEMLEIGARVAREAGLENIETQVMDGTNLELPDSSFDAVICRFALMFFSDPASALRGVNRVLHDGGRVSILIYAVDGAPEWMEAASVVRNQAGLPDSPAAAEDLGEPDVLRRTLEDGGFREIETHLLSLPIHMTSAAEYVRYLQATSPTLSDLVSELPEDERRRVWNKVKNALSVYEGSEGFASIHNVIVGAGTAD